MGHKLCTEVYEIILWVRDKKTRRVKIRTTIVHRAFVEKVLQCLIRYYHLLKCRITVTNLHMLKKHLIP